MARITKPLTTKQISTAKPKEKQYNLYDGNGLLLIVFPNGKKKWRYDYTFNKKRNSLSLGGYPEISLKEAREKTIENNKLKNSGEDPKKIKIKNTLTLEQLSNEYISTREDWADNTRKDMIQRLEKNIYPYLGDRDIKTLKNSDIIDTIMIMDKRGATNNAKKVFSLLNMMFRYAATLSKMDRNIMADIDRNIIFTQVKKKNFAHTTDPETLKDVLFAIDEYRGDYNTKIALKILPYLFVRPYPLRYMEWDEIDFDKKIWSVPKEKMKTDIDFIVPLCDFVLDVLRKHSSQSNLVFHSVISRTTPLSENTFNAALKRMGFNLTAHGFRHTASTLLHENIHIHNIPSNIIEIQLSHKVGSSVHRVYNKAQYIEDRIKLMNWWGDYLNNLKLITN